MKSKILISVLGAVLTLPVGVAILGFQDAPRAPTPPAAPAPPRVFAAPRPPQVFVTPEPAEEIDVEVAPEFEFGETPEPPETPEPALAPGMVQDSFVLLGDGGTWLGVRMKDVSADKARELKLSGEYGALVLEVEADSPAAKAGLKQDDVIVEFAGERVRSVAHLQRLVRETPAGRSVALQVFHGGQPATLNVKLEDGWSRFKAPKMEFPRVRMPEMNGFRFERRGATLGITAEELTKQLAEYFGVKDGKGVLVREVKSGSAAEKAGLKAGDVIVKIENSGIASVEELRRALPHDLEDKKKINLTVVRDRREQTLAVEIEATRRVPLRRAKAVAGPHVDLSEMQRLAAEYQQQARQYQEEAQKYAREVKEQSQHWQEEARRAMELAQRDLKKQLEDNWLEKLDSGEGVI